MRVDLGAVIGELRNKDNKERRGERRACPKAVCGGGGSELVTNHCCKREPRDPGKESPGRGHQ